MAVSPLTGAGNLWLWLPQVRFEQDVSFAAGTGLRAQMGVIQTREAGPYAGSNFTGTVEPARPGLEGRFEFFHHLDDDRRLEIAPGFHSSETHVAGQSVPSSIFSRGLVLQPLAARRAQRRLLHRAERGAARRRLPAGLRGVLREPHRRRAAAAAAGRS